MSSDATSFRELLRRLRTSAALSQEALATRAGLSLRGISDLERGVRRAPHLATVRLIADALALGPAERHELLAAARPHASAAPQDTLDPAVLPLPAPLTALIGREREQAALMALLGIADHRLVTLTGVGGTGKTRLALEVGARLRDEFPDGVVFVDLAPLTDANLVVSTIANSLGVRERLGQRLLDTLARFLAAKRMLLIVDNCEQVLAAAPDIATILNASPRVSLLATSREALRVRGEREFPVAPLPLPAADRPCSVEELGDAPAVALFVERAVASHPAFALTPDNAAAVAAICRRLDGLPLAIELAAARTRILPPHVLLTRLEHRLPVLTGGSRDLPPRQRTMRDAIAWSYDLLGDEEQRLFRRLAVFVGGWTLDAAESVSGGRDGPDVVAGLQALVESNLVQAVGQTDGERRFAMLETVREFGLERLGGSSEGVATRAAHAALYLTVAEAVAPEAWGAAGSAELGRLAAELGNLRAALGWLVEREAASHALRLAVALQPFWYLRGHFAEGRGWLERALAIDGDAGQDVRGRALFAAGVLVAEQAELGPADALLEAAIPLLGESGDRRWLVHALNHRASVALSLDELSRAESLCQEAMTVAREEQEDELLAHPTINLGRVAAARGDYALAEQLVKEARAKLLSAGAYWHAAVSCMMLGGVAQAQGEFGRAAALYREALPVFAALPDPATLARCLEGLASVAVASGCCGECARLLSAAEGLRAGIGHPIHPEDRVVHARAFTSARAGLGPAQFAAAWAAGQALTPEETVSEALAVADEVAPRSET